MYKGIYTVLSGAVLKQAQMDVISQNLANADTAGYKKENIAFKDYLIPKDMISLEPDGRIMSDVSAFTTDYTSGSMVYTGNPLDVAINGEGFFALEGGRYTKRGDFKKDDEGYLVSFNDVKVLGSSGTIRLPDGKIEISESGSISVNGVLIDSLKVVDFANRDVLSRVGESSFTTNETGSKSKAMLKQGALEKSNVEVIKEMVKMIVSVREFAAYQKVIQAFDDATSKATNEMARL